MTELAQPEVLIVEDDKFNVRLLSDLCRRCGYSVRVAMDGLAGLEAVAEAMPDVVLLDAMLPKLDGFGVLTQLRSAPSSRALPVIMVTALQDHATRLKAVDLGVDDFVTKPFRVADLRARLGGALATTRFEQALVSG